MASVLSNLGEDFPIDETDCRHCRSINKLPMLQLRIAEIETKLGVERWTDSIPCGCFAE
jgi:hypothetical protein